MQRPCQKIISVLIVHSSTKRPTVTTQEDIKPNKLIKHLLFWNKWLCQAEQCNVSYSQPTNKFESENAMRHSPLYVILLRRCVVIPCQQVHLQEKTKEVNQSSKGEKTWMKTVCGCVCVCVKKKKKRNL